METLPCQFCDAGDKADVTVVAYIRSAKLTDAAIRFEVLHQMVINGKTMEDVIAAWNRRANFPTNGT